MQGDDASLLVAVEQFGDRGGLPPFSFQRLLEPFQHASLADVLDGLGAARNEVGDVPIGPRRPVFIGLQENLRASRLLAAAVVLADRLLTDPAFLRCELNDVLFLHPYNPNVHQLTAVCFVRLGDRCAQISRIRDFFSGPLFWAGSGVRFGRPACSRRLPFSGFGPVDIRQSGYPPDVSWGGALGAGVLGLCGGASPTLYPHYSFWTTPARSRRPMR